MCLCVCEIFIRYRYISIAVSHAHNMIFCLWVLQVNAKQDFCHFWAPEGFVVLYMTSARLGLYASNNVAVVVVVGSLFWHTAHAAHVLFWASVSRQRHCTHVCKSVSPSTAGSHCRAMPTNWTSWVCSLLWPFCYLVFIFEAKQRDGQRATAAAPN